ncbi:hypothetical protein WJU16_11400 [Chitinophaga pollutisoli]|uniref:Uncharacterized protein n=1 Tax=Chitinophaga pollutisoli TaxID=3133966 RepID=A0ABZ2YVC5_9BACT
MEQPVLMKDIFVLHHNVEFDKMQYKRDDKNAREGRSMAYMAFASGSPEISSVD